METRLTIDWISSTSHNVKDKMQYTSIPALHDWENWEIVNGVNGYTTGAKHESGAKIYENLQRQDMGKHIIYSGKTLQRINAMYNVNSIEVLNHHIESGHNITRIDIALDFINYELNVSDFQWAFMQGKVATRLRKASVIQSLTDTGHTLYIGSRKKRKKLVRVYDKGAEMGWDYPCIRVEVQLMGKPATTVAIEAVRSGKLAQTLLGAMKNVVDFKTIPAWSNAMEQGVRVDVGTESDKLGDTLAWLEGSVRSSLIKHALLDLEWWVQYKLDLDAVISKHIED